ncbi:PER1 protein [Umbelopsis sp. AD052]|nr:PER1 protein [Umbelopsis sp. AD052]
MSRLLCTGLLLSLFLAITLASTGDQRPQYRNCVTDCSAKYCPTELQLCLRATFWTCEQNCQYHCMQEITRQAIQNGDEVHQYHGKWPFHRLFGIQEPASVLFSMLNGWMHYKYLPVIQKQIPSSYPLKKLYIAWCIIGINTWIWSTVFHIRDFPLTEKLDYFSAGFGILYSLYYAIIRLFYVRNALIIKGLTVMFALMFLAHVSYLSFVRFDYGYNMLACIVIGSIQTNLWLWWSILQYTPWGDKQRRPYAWLAGFSVIAISCAMALEVFDFPPWFGVIDAHSLWHAATIPLVAVWYNFLLKDTSYELTLGNDRGSSKRMA